MATTAILGSLSFPSNDVNNGGVASTLNPSFHNLLRPSLSSVSSRGSISEHQDSGYGSERHRIFPPPLEPRSFTVLKAMGDGSFGTVFLADWLSPLSLPPGTLPPGPSSRPEYAGKRLVAIKKMKKAFEIWDDCMKLKELKSLQQLPMHANIIPLYDAFLSPATKELHFVFECMEGNLYQLTKSRKGRPLASGLIASVFYQILSGLDHIHRNGYFHRDMKPENLLITTTGLSEYPASSLYALPGTPTERDVMVVVKIADFGLARETASVGPYTEYVSTRWYRSPEILLRSRDYSNPVDLWAVGTIMAEVITLKPIFPGDSEVDQVYRICEMLGDPSSEYGVDEVGRIRGGGPWTRGVRMAKTVGFTFPKLPPKSLLSIFDSTTVPSQLVDCIADLLRYEPANRLTTRQCLDHDYFRVVARFAPYQQSSSSSTVSTPTVARYDPRLYAASDASSIRSYPLPPTTGTSLTSSVADLSSPVGSQWGRIPIEYRQPPPPAFDQYRSIPAFGSHMARPASVAYSNAASTFYDGSIFEGIAPSRASSIMSFPIGYGTESSIAETSSVRYGGYNGHHSIPEDDQHSTSSSLHSRPNPRNTYDHSIAPPPVQLPVKTSRSWSLGSVFSTSSSAPSIPSTSTHHELKRQPSTTTSMHQSDVPRSPPLDPKKAKKEAEKAAKEAEKARREALAILSRERARAVMRKNALLLEAADPLHATSSRVEVRKSKSIVAGGPTNPGLNGSSSSKSNGKLPQIVESSSRLSAVDTRFKMRRRDDDDDVHSISSSDNGAYHRGRPYSVSSQATSSSEPDMRPGRHLTSPHHLVDPRFHRPPNSAISTTSSLDQQFITDMKGLATSGEPRWTDNNVDSNSSSNFHHRDSRESARESGVDPRYNPYPTSRSPANFTLPPIDASGHIQHPRRPPIIHRNSSISSIHSAPSTSYWEDSSGHAHTFLPSMESEDQ